MRLRCTLALGLGFVAAAMQAATLHLAPLFADHAVLQREVAHPIWGEAQPGADVRVEFAGQQLTVRADAAGRWSAVFAPLAANANGATLRVESAGERVVATDVLVGEVWLCSGQSNMEWTLKNSPKLAEVQARGRVPTLRHFKVARTVADAPATSVGGDWKPLDPDTAASFSAVAYHFADSLQARLGVPVGLVNSSWGATAAEPWMTPGTLAKFPAIAERWEKSLVGMEEKKAAYEQEREEWKKKAAAAKARGEKVGTDWPKPPLGRGSHRQPGGLFNGMIAPLVPFPFRGVLWYQAEAHTGRAKEYAELFPAMIEGWRAAWGGEPAWFVFVQLPNYNVPNDRSGLLWAELRDAQTSALALPRTAMAVTIDAGVPDNGHPPDKTIAGQRLARLALAHIFGVEQGDASGPRAVEARIAGDEVLVRFADARSGLTVRGPELSGVEIVDSASTPHPAAARIEGDAVRVRIPAGVVPASVRYAWQNNPSVTLQNGAGLPAAPFKILVPPATPSTGAGQTPNPTSR